MPRPPSLPERDRPLCPGREEVSDRFEVALDRAKAGHGGTWMITGPAGIGKSYLLNWLAGRAEARGFTVLRGACSEWSEVPLGPLEEAVRGLPTDRRPRSGVGRGASTSHAEEEPLAPGPRLLALVQRLHRAGTERPVALLLDDLDWADPETVLAFQALARGMGGMRVLLVGALRTPSLGDDVARQAAWGRTLPLLATEGTMESVPLGGLNGERLRTIAEEVAGARFPGAEGSEFAIALEARTEGNPLFARELAVRLKEQGHLVVEAGRAVLQLPEPPRDGAGVGGGWGRLPLPPSLRRLVLSKLERVPPADLPLLTLGALAGSPFGVAPLAGTLSRSTRGIVGSLENLRGQGILEHLGDDEEEGWSFTHDLVWELALRESPPEELRELARRLAGWWGEAHPDEVETVARLYHDARDATDGLPWVRDAIERALQSSATASAERFFGWYFELLARVPEPPEAMTREALSLVDRLLVRRIRRETVAVLEELGRTRLSPDLAWEVDWRAAHILISFDLRAAEARLRSFSERLSRQTSGPSDRQRGVLAFVRCEVAGARLRWTEAIEQGEEALRRLEPGGNVWLRGRVVYEVGWAESMLDRREEARARVAQAKALLGTEDVPSLQASLLILEGTLALDLAKLDEAVEAYAQAQKMLLQVGGMEGYGVAINNRAEALLLSGRVPEARKLLEEAEMVGLRFAYPRILHGCALKRAWADVLEGRWKEALARLEEVERWAREGDFTEEDGERRLLHAWSLGESGSPEGGLRELEKLRRTPAQLQPQTRPYLARAHARLLELAGRPGVKEAWDRALQSAEQYGGEPGLAQVRAEIAGWQARQTVLTPKSSSPRTHPRVAPEGPADLSKG